MEFFSTGCYKVQDMMQIEVRNFEFVPADAATKSFIVNFTFVWIKRQAFAVFFIERRVDTFDLPGHKAARYQQQEKDRETLEHLCASFEARFRSHR